MASFNEITIVGYLGRDPELKYAPNGTAVCTFSIATSEKRKDSNGEMQDLTTWFRVTYFGKQAELASQYLAKGRQVYVSGPMRLSEFTDREGNKRATAEVTGSKLQFLGDRGDSAPKQAAAAAQSQQQSSKETKRKAIAEALGDEQPEDEIPF